MTLFLAVALGPVRADDAPKAAAPTPEQTADAVLAAKDAAALRSLAVLDAPDPWLVADELVRRGAHDAAEAFARAAPRVDTEALPAYVASRRGASEDPARRQRLTRATQALGAQDPRAALTALGDPEPSAEDVVGVRLATARGRALEDLFRPADAHAAYGPAAVAAERLGWGAQACALWSWAGGAAFRASAFAQAHEAFQRSLALAERRGDRWRAASALSNIGIFHAATGEYERALTTNERALAELEALGDEASAANTLGNIGHLHLLLGDPAKALAAHERALAAHEALGDRAGAAGVLGSIGHVQVGRGEFTKALATYQRALATQEALGDRPGAARSLGGMGHALSELGDYARALATFERSLAAHESVGDRGGAATALANIGNVHLELGDFAKASDALERALAVQESLGARAAAARTLGNLGNVQRARGDPAKALASYERALAAEEALGDRWAAASTLGNIGVLHSAQGDHAKALATYERALAAKEALGDRAGAATTLGNVGRSRMALGDAPGARQALERAVRSARSLRAVPVLVAALADLAKVHLASGSASRALGAAREALVHSESLLGGLGMEQGAQAREGLAELFAVGALAAAREDDAAEAFAFLESGRAGALLDALGTRETLRWTAENLPEELRALDAAAQAAEKRARKAYDQAAKVGDRKAKAAAGRALDEALEDLRAVSARIERERRRAAPLFYARANTLEEVRAALEDDEALVSYGLCMGVALALVIQPTSERILTLGRQVEVEALCRGEDLRSPGGDAAAALEGLRRALVAPLGLGPEVKRVLVSPEGALGYLPFGALFDLPVAVTPSGTTHALLRAEEREAGDGVLALGDPDYGGVADGVQAVYHRGRPLKPLPATRAEVEAIGTLTLLGSRASEDELRAALPARKRWRAVHFACHGLVDAERPALSSLALSRAGEQDGFLTMREVLRLEIPADLAVLSACETATGRIVVGEGIVGLTRAFMYAGTPRVLCSLWKVDDEATAALMKKFYELWLGATRAAVAPSEPGAAPGESKDPERAPRVEGSKGASQETPSLSAAEALRQAQAHVRAQEKWKHPYYWAAWVLWGLP